MGYDFITLLGGVWPLLAHAYRKLAAKRAEDRAASDSEGKIGILDVMAQAMAPKRGRSASEHGSSIA